MSNPKRRNYSPEFKDEAVQLVLAGPGTVTDVARELGLNPQTLRNWVNKHQEAEPGAEPPLSISERARLRELEREVVELREKTRFLGKAAAFFAQTHR
ncbi:transposase [Glycomyces albus]